MEQWAEKAKVLVAQWCRLPAIQWTVAHQAPLSMGFSRREYWSGLPVPSLGDLPNSGIKSWSSALQADSFPSEPPRKHHSLLKCLFISYQTNSNLLEDRRGNSCIILSLVQCLKLKLLHKECLSELTLLGEGVVIQSLSCVWLHATLWAAAHQAPLSMGFSRREYWSGLPCPPSGDLPNSGIEPRFPSLEVNSLLSESWGQKHSVLILK